MIALLKVKAFLHEAVFLVSFGMAITMLVEAKSNIYPDLPCYICAATALLNVAYSAWLLVECNKEIEEIEARERR